MLGPPNLRMRESVPWAQNLWHTSGMAKISFRILPQGEGDYAVEVTEPGDPAYTVTGFKSEAEAEAWVADRQFSGKVADQWVRLPDGERRY